MWSHGTTVALPSAHMLSRPFFLRQPLGAYHPLLQDLAIRLRRAERHGINALDWRSCARACPPAELPFRLKRHQSVLISPHCRDHGADGYSGLELQVNKVASLRIVAGLLDGVVIPPGRTFSFWRLVGRPTAKRGFRVGMELAQGLPRAGIGGGICQAANLIHWLALHSPLRVVERHHHSFDPFPDSGRILPFGSGATVFYNYRDLRLHNPGPDPIQLKLSLGKKCLHGALLTDQRPAVSYRVVERNHAFLREGERIVRTNELWQIVRRRSGDGRIVREERICANRAEVRYEVEPGLIRSSSAPVGAAGRLRPQAPVSPPARAANAAVSDGAASNAAGSDATVRDATVRDATNARGATKARRAEPRRVRPFARKLDR